MVFGTGLFISMSEITQIVKTILIWLRKKQWYVGLTTILMLLMTEII